MATQPVGRWKRALAHWTIILMILLVPGALLGGLYIWTNVTHPKRIWDVILRESVAHLNEVAPPPGSTIPAPSVRIYEERFLQRQIHCVGPVQWSIESHRALSAACPTEAGMVSAIHELDGKVGHAWYQVERSGQTNLLLVDASGNVLAREPLKILPRYDGKSIGGDEGEE